MRRHLRKRLVKYAGLAVLAAIIVVPSAAGFGSKAKAPYKLAYIGDFTGGSATIGAPSWYGFKTYIDWVNRHGGVKGRQIKVSQADDASDPAKARIAFNAAAASGALGIFGGTTTIAWLPLLQNAQGKHILLDIQGVLDNYIDPPQPYLYAVSISFQAKINAQYGFVKNYLIANHLVSASPTIGELQYSSAAATTMKNFGDATLSKLGWGGGSLKVYQSFAIGATDVSSQAAAVARANPDVLIVQLLESNAALVVHALRAAGYNGYIVCHDGVTAPSVLKAVNDPKFFTMRTYASPASTSIPGVKTMLAQAKATHNTATIDTGSSWFTGGYISGVLAVKALQKCPGACNRTFFNASFEGLGLVNTNGLNPSSGITPLRHRQVGQARFYHYDNGKDTPAGGWVKGVQPKP